MKILNNGTFEILKDNGAVVPRDKDNYIISFIVGKEYTVCNEDKTASLRVRCTQDSPHHLTIITAK